MLKRHKTDKEIFKRLTNSEDFQMQFFFSFFIKLLRACYKKKTHVESQ